MAPQVHQELRHVEGRSTLHEPASARPHRLDETGYTAGNTGSVFLQQERNHSEASKLAAAACQSLSPPHSRQSSPNQQSPHQLGSVGCLHFVEI
eukprot:CAMPEP_0172671598 /NCGR_PEP_ID=MMETSP1074-20121228/11017_1 /TAXON_ID=2916 /ORGANISM="Ceratium fusus, Strain PA161109" /LENGTH=93 /DNA_ID=CAMNT_0013488673 /DNA_START=617 /DNA_END=898 /DNA_ORIENTATION=+